MRGVLDMNIVVSDFQKARPGTMLRFDGTGRRILPRKGSPVYAEKGYQAASSRSGDNLSFDALGVFDLRDPQVICRLQIQP